MNGPHGTSYTVPTGNLFQRLDVLGGDGEDGDREGVDAEGVDSDGNVSGMEGDGGDGHPRDDGDGAEGDEGGFRTPRGNNRKCAKWKERTPFRLTLLKAGERSDALEDKRTISVLEQFAAGASTGPN